MFRYPGGKGKVKQQIYDALKSERALLGNAAEFREPFLGGGAVSLYCAQQCLTNLIWLNDYDLGIASIWHCALNEHKRLIEAVENYKPNVDDFWRFKTDLTNPDFVQQATKLQLAMRKIIVHQFSYSGLGVKSGSPIGGKTQVDESGATKKYAFDCRWSPKKITKDILDFQKLMHGMCVRQQTCTQLDYRELIDEPGEALIYLDPPYYEQGEALYQYYFNEEQHIELANMLRETKHQWVLSYDNHPRICELYSWANIKDLDIKYSISGAKGAKEVIITKN